MNIEIQHTSDTRKIATVSFESGEVDAEEKKVLGLFSQHAKIPGFRPGKAPAEVVRSRFAEGVKEEWSKRLSEAARDEVLKHDELRVHQLLKIEPGEILLGAPVDVVVTLDVEPDFDLPDYEKFELEVPSAETEPKDIKDLIESWRQQRADFSVVERAVEKNDYVKCSYHGTIDDQPVEELVPDKAIYGKQANTWEEAGSEDGIGIPAIVEGLVGMKAGEKKSCDAEFPEDYSESRLAGKKAVYELEVHEVRQKKLPELSDEQFLKSMEVDSADALKERAENEARLQKERSNETEKRKQIRGKLLEAVEIEIPQAALENETQEIFRAMVDANLRRGVAQTDLENHKDEMFATAGQDAKDSVKLRIILGRVAEQEKVEVSREDLTQVIASQAMMSGQDPREHFKEFQQDRARMVALHQQVLFDKTLALLTEKAKVKINEQTEGNDADDET